MNRVVLPAGSSVVVAVMDPGPSPYFVLRCFRCDWATAAPTSTAALEAGIAHEAEHAAPNPHQGELIER